MTVHALATSYPLCWETVHVLSIFAIALLQSFLSSVNIYIGL